MTTRYAQARERAGLTRAQAIRILGFPTDHIERGAESPTPDRHAAMARAYGVSECWLRGHDPDPDLDELVRQAKDKQVSPEDWREVVLLIVSGSTCATCPPERKTRDFPTAREQRDDDVRRSSRPCRRG